ncbi:MAG: phosphotransferase [Deltaproteobacteria bacterium]|nr:phosphotransferase [Deltaproteobacteria bacterium]
MSSRDDESLIARDRALPGLATVLDGEAMADALASQGIRGLGEIVPCYVRYKPGTSCLVGYRANPGDGVVFLHATTYADGLQDKVGKAGERALRAANGDRGLPGGGCLYLEGVRAAVAFHPFDADLPSMVRLADADARAALLARIFRDDAIGPRNEVHRLAYKPGRRFVGRVTRSDGRPAVVRLYANLERARALRIPRSLVDGDVLRVARRVGGSKRHRAAAVDWIPGAPLRDAVRGRPAELEGTISVVARAVAELHQTKLVDGETLPRRGATEGLVEAERELAWLVPSHAGVATALRARIESSLARIPTSEALIHGDLYDKQIVISAEGVGLVDLDELGIGDPRQDLGLFLAHWERDRALGDLDAAVGGIGEALGESYREASSSRLVGLPVFTAAALYRLSQHPFRTRSPEWSAKIVCLLERVHTLLGS